MDRTNQFNGHFIQVASKTKIANTETGVPNHMVATNFSNESTSKHRTQAHLQMECLGDEYGSQSDKATKVTSGSLRKMLDDQDYRCAITGIKLTPRSAVLDHIQPLSKGGDHALSNVHIVDVRINKMKGTFPLEEFISHCKLVAESNGFGG